MRDLVRKKGFSGAVKNRHTAQSGLAPNVARQKYCDWTVTGERAVCCWHFLPSLARLSSRCRPISIVLFLRRDEEVALVFVVQTRLQVAREWSDPRCLCPVSSELAKQPAREEEKKKIAAAATALQYHCCPLIAHCPLTAHCPLPIAAPHPSQAAAALPPRPTKTRQPVATISPTTSPPRLDARLDPHLPPQKPQARPPPPLFLPPAAALLLPPSRSASPWRRPPMRLRCPTASSTRRSPPHLLHHPIHPRPPGPPQNGSANRPTMATTTMTTPLTPSPPSTATNRFATRNLSSAITTTSSKGARHCSSSLLAHSPLTIKL